MDQDSLFQMIGLMGSCVYIGGFAALQLGYICGNGRLYVVTNMLAASLVLISLTSAFNFASVIIQISWLAIGTYRLLRHEGPEAQRAS